MTDDYSALVADFASGLSFEDLPDDLVAAALRPIVDTVGVIFAGRRSSAGEVARRYAYEQGAGAGDGFLVADALAMPAQSAALVNSTMGHGLDFDDEMSLGGGHPSSLILSAILALPAPKPLSGTTLLEAYVAGHEVAAWMAKSLGPMHYRRGWHVTATAGALGATVAAAKILGFDATSTRMAIGVAASMVGGLQRNFGTMTKPLHSGLAARNGVLAAQLVQAGLSASADILDGPKGFFDMFGEGASAPEQLKNLGRTWALLEPGTSLKKYPCCYATHRSTDAMLEIQAEHGFRPDEVTAIECNVPIGALAPLIHNEPVTGLQGKFSMQYTLAAAFLDRELRLDSFTDAAVQRPAIVDLMSKVIARDLPRCRPEDPENKFGGPGSGGFVEVIVQARGIQAMATVTQPSGSPAKPMTRADIDAKFLDCVRYGDGGDEQAARDVLGRLGELEKEPDVHSLLAELSSTNARSAV